MERVSERSTIPIYEGYVDELEKKTVFFPTARDASTTQLCRSRFKRKRGKEEKIIKIDRAYNQTQNPQNVQHRTKQPRLEQNTEDLKIDKNDGSTYREIQKIHEYIAKDDLEKAAACTADLFKDPEIALKMTPADWYLIGLYFINHPLFNKLGAYCLRKYLEVEPASKSERKLNALKNLAYYYNYKEHDQEKSKDIYLSILNDYPSYHFPRYELGKLYDKEKNYEQAHQMFLALSETPGSYQSKACYFLGIYWRYQRVEACKSNPKRKIDNIQHAIMYFKQALEIDSDYAFAYKNLAFIYNDNIQDGYAKELADYYFAKFHEIESSKQRH